LITLDDVTKNYGDVHALGPVDLEIPTGGVTALVGPNGAGTVGGRDPEDAS
jgi:iron complex transport system ATP-binding protein